MSEGAKPTSDQSSNRPYVVTGDLPEVLTPWAERYGYKLPDKGFFNERGQELKSFLEAVFPEGVDLVQGEEIREGINQRAALFRDLPLVSFDGVYVDQRTPNVVAYIEMTRAVDENFEKIGYVPRPGVKLSYDEQLTQAAARIKAKNPDGDFGAIDDVLFEGGTASKFLGDLAKLGCTPRTFIVGVAAQSSPNEAVQGHKSGKELLEERGIPVLAVRTYPEGWVEEICQRDTVAGIGGTQKRLDDGTQIAAPYTRPWGDPIGRASIPHGEADAFSDFAVDQSIHVWDAIGKASGGPIPIHTVPRPFEVPTNRDIVTALRESRRRRIS